jgi:WD40 repeat protein
LTDVIISNDNNNIITISKDKTAIIWSLNTGIKINVLIGHTNKINCVAISHDNLKVITGSDDNRVIIWDIKTGT